MSMNMDLTIRYAKPSEALFLTSISFSAKRYWDYPEEYLGIWHNELTITEKYIEENIVFVAQEKDTIIGYCSVTEVKQAYWRGETFIKVGHWLDHIFIRQAYIRKGIGRKLIEGLVDYCRGQNIGVLNILSDPESNDFFDKIGAVYIQDMPSNIKGREACLYEFTVSQKSTNKLEEDGLLSKSNELVGSSSNKRRDQVQDNSIEIATISREESIALLNTTERLEVGRAEEMKKEILQGEGAVEKAEEDNIFHMFNFNRRGFQMELEDLEKKRMYLEQEELEQKLHELDKDMDEDSVYVFSNQENDVEEGSFYGYAEDGSIDNFEFTVPVGYKFQYEEEEIAFIQGVAEESEDYSTVDIEALYNSTRLEQDNYEEVQNILERVAKEGQEEREYIPPQEGDINADKGIHVKTEKEKMLGGEQYIAWGDEIVTDRRRARRILKEFNHTDPEDKKQTIMLLKELFGSIGEYIHIEPDFKCNYGYNIHIGDNFYAGYNCVILDNAKVTIGNNCILSPNVGIYTLAYPISAKKRMAGYEYAHPVTIGDNVWIGGGTVINPGITIGNDVVIEPGSVIVSDIPDGVLVGGNPAQIIKEINE